MHPFEVSNDFMPCYRADGRDEQRGTIKHPQVSSTQMNISEKERVRGSIGNCDEETRSMDEKSRDGGAIYVNFCNCGLKLINA